MKADLGVNACKSCAYWGIKTSSSSVAEFQSSQGYITSSQLKKELAYDMHFPPNVASLILPCGQAE